MNDLNDNGDMVLRQWQLDARRWRFVRDRLAHSYKTEIPGGTIFIYVVGTPPVRAETFEGAIDVIMDKHKEG